MHAMMAVLKGFEKVTGSDSSRFVMDLVIALGEEADFPLSKLYRLDYESFEAALDLLRDWRLDRYYASRLRLFDAVVSRSDADITRAELNS